MRRVLIASLLLNAALAAALGALWLAHRNVRREISLASSGWLHQPAREGFARLPSEPGSTVFLGDSLVAEGPWGELLSGPLNRGVKGDTVSGVRARLDEVLDRDPARIHLLVGINDVLSGSAPADVVAGVDAVAADVAARSPGTRLFVFSLLPVRDVEGPVDAATANERILAVNDGLRESVERHGAIFVDLHERLRGPDGRLRADLTYDGLHLTVEGYLLWRDVLAEHE